MTEAPTSHSFLVPGLDTICASGRPDAASRAQVREAGMLELHGLAGMIEQRLEQTGEALPFKTADDLTAELEQEFGATITLGQDGNLTISLCGVTAQSYGGPSLAMLRNWQLKARFAALALMT